MIHSSALCAVTKDGRGRAHTRSLQFNATKMLITWVYDTDTAKKFSLVAGLSAIFRSQSTL